MVLEHLPMAYQTILAAGEVVRYNLTTPEIYQNLSNNTTYVAGEVAKTPLPSEFNGIFALTGLLALGYLIFGKKDNPPPSCGEEEF